MNKRLAKSLFPQIKKLIQTSRSEVMRSINFLMIELYFNIGKLIIEHEQKGKQRAAYSAEVLKNLSALLTQEFGKGFSVDNLENMRRFYTLYNKDITSRLLMPDSKSASSKSETLSRKSGNVKSASSKSETLSRKSNFKLSWSHYLLLMKIENVSERRFYEIESVNESWSVRELKRQFNSGLYERLTYSRNKKKVKELSKKGQVIRKPEDAIKDPYILEFLSLKEYESYSEEELETALISKLKDFILELGKGFLFVERQYRITFDEKHFRIDLVLYNRILKCFVLIDLKIGDLEHKDIGQMQMYINYFDDEVKEKDENKTIGIIMCKTKTENVVKYTIPKGFNQIFTSKYKTYLPPKKDLQLLMEPGEVYTVKKNNEHN